MVMVLEKITYLNHSKKDFRCSSLISFDLLWTRNRKLTCEIGLTLLTLPWWLILSSSLYSSLNVSRMTSMNAMSCPQISQMSTSLTYEVGGSFSITL